MKKNPIFAFDHPHAPGDVCSLSTCEHARRAPVLAGTEVLEDLPQRILRAATAREYLNQPVPKGWVVPPLVHGCDYLYEVELIVSWRSRRVVGRHGPTK